MPFSLVSKCARILYFQNLPPHTSSEPDQSAPQKKKSNRSILSAVKKKKKEKKSCPRRLSQTEIQSDDTEAFFKVLSFPSCLTFTSSSWTFFFSPPPPVVHGGGFAIPAVPFLFSRSLLRQKSISRVCLSNLWPLHKQSRMAGGVRERMRHTPRAS